MRATRWDSFSSPPAPAESSQQFIKARHTALTLTYCVTPPFFGDVAVFELLPDPLGIGARLVDLVDIL